MIWQNFAMLGASHQDGSQSDFQALGLFGWTLYVLPVSTLVLSGYSDFTQSKNMQS